MKEKKRGTGKDKVREKKRKYNDIKVFKFENYPPRSTLKEDLVSVSPSVTNLLEPNYEKLELVAQCSFGLQSCLEIYILNT